MAKYSVNMLVLCSVSLFSSLICPATGYAIDFQGRSNSALSELEMYLEDGGKEILPASAESDVPRAPEYITFTDGAEETLDNGGINRKFGGHSVYVKLLFLRGNYDPYTQTYKSIPAVSIHDATAASMGKSILSGENYNFTFNDLKLYVEFAGKAVTLKNNSVPSESVTLEYDDLLLAWAANASKYCSIHLSAKYCFVPQHYWDGAHHYGLVVSSNTPLYYTTGFPQDFVELYKTENGNLSFKPIAFSLSIRSAFVLSPDQRYLWEFRPMTAEEVGEAMIDRTKPFVGASARLTSPTIPNRE